VDDEDGVPAGVTDCVVNGELVAEAAGVAVGVVNGELDDEADGMKEGEGVSDGSVMSLLDGPSPPLPANLPVLGPVRTILRLNE